MTQVLRAPPRDRGSHYYSLVVMDADFPPSAFKVLSHMLPESVLNPCPPAHWSMAGNSIHAWQHQPNNHLLATHVLCPRRNLEVSAVVTPCISWRAISFFHLFSNSLARALPHSASLVPILHSSWLSCFGRSRSWDENNKTAKFKKGEGEVN